MGRKGAKGSINTKSRVVGQPKELPEETISDSDIAKRNEAILKNAEDTLFVEKEASIVFEQSDNEMISVFIALEEKGYG